MRIAAPLSAAAEAEILISAGADELFCGVTLAGSRPEHRHTCSRRQGPAWNLNSYDELESVVSVAHARNALVRITLNEPAYPRSLYPLLVQHAGRACGAGVDGIIVADLGLLLLLRRAQLPPVLQLSTCASAFNAQALCFFREFGVSRVTLPRQLRLDEVRDLAKMNLLELELLVMNDRCTFDDGTCFFAHSLWDGEESLIDGGGCGLKYRVCASRTGGERDNADLPKRRLPRFFSNPARTHACGACALHALRGCSITLKVSGRQNPIARKVADVRFLAELRGIAGHEALDEAEFRRVARRVYECFYGVACSQVDCYYALATA